MRVDSKTVQGRRKLKFSSFDEVIADAEMLASSPETRTIGNWPLDRLLTHLATAINGSIDGLDFKVPWFARLMGPFIKRLMMKQGWPPGFNLPKDREAGAYPGGFTPHEAVDKLRAAVARTKHEKMTARHPVFGALTHEEWTKLHLYHAAMHLSFAVPPPVTGTD